MNAENRLFASEVAASTEVNQLKTFALNVTRIILKNLIDHDEGPTAATSSRSNDDGRRRSGLAAVVIDDGFFNYNYNFVEPSSDNPSGNAKKKNGCRCCNKKVGLLGFECRCRGTFCSIHRYPESHACKHDFKTAAGEVIEKANPVCLADKLDNRV